MPQSYRWALKQELQRSIKYIECAENGVVKVAQNYKEKYPDIYVDYIKTVAFMEDLKTIVEALKDKI